MSPWLLGLGPGVRYSISIFINECTGAIRILSIWPRHGREKYNFTGFKLYCYTVVISGGVRMPVVDCDSQNKKLVAEARYMCNVANQPRYLAAA